jgi:hypothetical protein
MKRFGFLFRNLDLRIFCGRIPGFGHDGFGVRLKFLQICRVLRVLVCVACKVDNCRYVQGSSLIKRGYAWVKKSDSEIVEATCDVNNPRERCEVEAEKEEMKRK